MRKAEWVILVLFIAYSAMCAVPVTALWYNPGIPTFGNAVEGQPVPLEYSRTLFRLSFISYTVVVRQVDQVSPACDGGGGTRALWVPSMLVGAHPLHTYRLTHCARQQCRISAGVLVTIPTVTASAFDIDDMHMVGLEAEHLGDLGLQPVRAL